jgi:hypothetical protein
VRFVVLVSMTTELIADNLVTRTQGESVNAEIWIELSGKGEMSGQMRGQVRKELSSVLEDGMGY